MSKAYKDLIKNIDDLMKVQGWTQRSLADRTGLSQGAISTYITGKVAPQLDALTRLADAFGVSPSRLLMGDDEEDVVIKFKRITLSRAEIIEQVRRDLIVLQSMPEEVFDILRLVSERGLWDGFLEMARGFAESRAVSGQQKHPLSKRASK